MTDSSRLNLLVGKYFLAPFPHDDQGIVEAVIDDGHCLVRFEAEGNRPEAFAVVREAGKRTLNMRHFDVQLIGGMVLHYGKIAEMRTGEGKTLVATLPLYLNALTGRGAHLVTTNDYLARRDGETMGQLYGFLGLTTGIIQHDQYPTERRAQYYCDISYGMNSEFGFDYLRDNGMAERKEYQVQRGHKTVKTRSIPLR